MDALSGTVFAVILLSRRAPPLGPSSGDARIVFGTGLPGQDSPLGCGKARPRVKGDGLKPRP
jgi:hypothetical protein